MGYFPEFNHELFYQNPTTQALLPYTVFMGFFFYLSILVIMNGLLLYTKGWKTASISTIATSIFFSGVFSSFPYIIWIWSIAACFVFAAAIVDATMNKTIG